MIYCGERQNLSRDFGLFEALTRPPLVFVAESRALSKDVFAACESQLTVNSKLCFCCWLDQPLSIHWQFGRSAPKLLIAGLGQNRLV